MIVREAKRYLEYTEKIEFAGIRPSEKGRIIIKKLIAEIEHLQAELEAKTRELEQTDFEAATAIEDYRLRLDAEERKTAELLKLCREVLKKCSFPVKAALIKEQLEDAIYALSEIKDVIPGKNPKE